MRYTVQNIHDIQYKIRQPEDAGIQIFIDLKPPTKRKYTCCNNVLKCYTHSEGHILKFNKFFHSYNKLYEFFLILTITSSSVFARSSTDDDLHERPCACIISARLCQSTTKSLQLL